MAILSSEAVVISSIPQGETSKIIRLYTRDFGRVSVIAKGSRKWKNRFGGMLEPLNHIAVVYYSKESRELQVLSQCDVINTFQGVKSDLNKLALGLSIAEIIQELTVEERGNPELFSLVTNALNALESAARNYYNYYWYFLMRFLRDSGFGLDMKSCRGCGLNVDEPPAFFSVSRGGVLCRECVVSESAKQMSRETHRVLQHIESGDAGLLANLIVSDRAVQEINSLMNGYFKFHFDGYTSPKAMKLFVKEG